MDCVQCMERVRCLKMGSNTDYWGEPKLKAACWHVLGHCWENRRHPETKYLSKDLAVCCRKGSPNTWDPQS